MKAFFKNLIIFVTFLAIFAVGYKVGESHGITEASLSFLQMLQRQSTILQRQ